MNDVKTYPGQPFTAQVGVDSVMRPVLVQVVHASDYKKLAEHRDELLVGVKKWAGECAECDGTGLVTIYNYDGHGSDADDQPCDQCAYIRALIAKCGVAARPRCEGCGNEIDPDTCGCGDVITHNAWNAGHAPIPMGCDCGRDTTP